MSPKATPAVAPSASSTKSSGKQQSFRIPKSAINVLALAGFVVLLNTLLSSAGQSVWPLNEISRALNPIGSASGGGKSAIASLRKSQEKTATAVAAMAQALSELTGSSISAGDVTSKIPRNKQFRFTMDDFLTNLGVVPIHNMEFDSSIEAFVRNHDVTTDEYYKLDPNEMEVRAQQFGSWIDRGTGGDKRFYIAFTDDVRGFGLFAASPIRKGDVLGVYSGVVTNSSWTTDYVWNYMGAVNDENGKVLDLGVDAKVRGNWFRFANDGPTAEINADVFYVPYKNIWYVVYVAAKAINADHEILCSYGPSYWASRTMIATNGKPVKQQILPN